MASLNLSLLAMSPRRITGDFAESIRRAASERECLAAGPCATGVDKTSRANVPFARLAANFAQICSAGSG